MSDNYPTSLVEGCQLMTTTPQRLLPAVPWLTLLMMMHHTSWRAEHAGYEQVTTKKMDTIKRSHITSG
jgi:hypothetical protein